MAGWRGRGVDRSRVKRRIPGGGVFVRGVLGEGWRSGAAHGSLQEMGVVLSREIG